MHAGVYGNSDEKPAKWLYIEWRFIETVGENKD